MARLSISLSVCCYLGTFFTAPLQAAPPLPYQAQVLEDQETYRSGPGRQFYVCGPLNRGEIVEVYRQNETGYLAIRPPRRASSWVLARDVEMTDQPDVGRVLRAGVISWIDSQLAEVPDNQWQVRLKKGELVEILEQRPVPGQPTETAEIYYRIAPPSGEFRWIPAQSVQPIRDSVRQTGFNSSGGDTERVQEAQYSLQTTVLPAEGWRDRRLANVNPQHSAVVEKVTINTTNKAASIDLAKPPASRIRRPFWQLQDEVSKMLSRKYSAAAFDQLHEQVEQFYQSMAGKPQREDARDLLERLEEFQRSSAIPNQLPSPVTADRGEFQSRVNAKPAKQVTGVAYDGVGWLMPVYSRDRSRPPFALLDDDGKLLQYVKPAPGVNLRRYARKNVGIFGTRLPVADGQSIPLTAYRVIDLARHR